MKTLLYLDDLHSPEEKISFVIKHYDNIVWVKSYGKFCEWILQNGLPDSISFDHDLHESHYAPAEHWVGTYRLWRDKNRTVFPTGKDCAKFLVNYCKDKGCQLPIWGIHSMNPIGSMEITIELMTYAEDFYINN